MKLLVIIVDLAIGAFRLIRSGLHVVFDGPPCPDCARLPEGRICDHCAWWRAIK